MLIEHGRIVALGPDDLVPRPDEAIDVDCTSGVVIPGLINVHTHLELTNLGRLDEPENFSGWIQRVRAAKADQSPEDFVEAARRGVQDMWRQGITTVADTGDSGATVVALTELGGRGVYYQEVFGPDPEMAEPALQALQVTVDALRDHAGDFVTVGVSPHAPYTVSESLYRLTAELARLEGLPVAIHIAESKAEVDLVVRGRGDFADRLRARGVPLPVRSASPVLYLERCGVLDVQPLAIHTVHVNRTDVEVLKRMQCSVASCPVSNRVHGHGDPPLELFADVGLRFGLGTDSVASVGATDLRAEAELAQNVYPALDLDTLRLLTLDGAKSLGMDGSVGSLDIGKFADLSVLSPRRALQGDWEVPAHTDDVLATFVAGRCVYRREPVPGLPGEAPG